MKVITMPGDKPGKNVDYLIKLAEGKALRFNDEYQRAPAWKTQQKQLFIDSIFRGYSIPAFYFHKTGSKVEDLGGQYYDVIDGQQRIRAIREFKNGNFPLLSADGFKKLPPFLESRNKQWDGCYYNALSPEMQNLLLHQPVVIYEMTTDNDNEIRDLFIRLQGGTSLSAQDKRDTYPGDLPRFVMEMGGKPPLNEGDIGRYRGHKFFIEITRGKEQVNRKLAAQLILLVSHNANDKEISVCDVNSRALDSFYLRSVGNFSDSCQIATRFKKNIGTICDIFPSNIPTLAGHEAIHLVLLVNSLSGGYAPGWEKKLPDVFSQFRQNYRKAKREETGDYYTHYVRWVSQSSDRASTIEERHKFFMREMLRMLAPMEKDSKRVFSTTEKEYIHLRDRGLCQWCRMRGNNNPKVEEWSDAEFHHITPHAEGGRTAPDNGALMHSKCHPHTPEAVIQFREWWNNEREKIQHPVSEKGKRRKISDLPDGTKCRFEYEDTEYEGQIVNGKLNMGELGTFSSFKKPSETITHDKTTQNWWLEWDILLPEPESKWMPADSWQPPSK